MLILLTCLILSLQNFPRIVERDTLQPLSTDLVKEEFVEEIGPRLAVSEPTQLGFFYQLFEDETFGKIADQTNEYA